jgi:integrase
MKHDPQKLNAKTVASLTLPLGKADHVIWDEDLRGFGYRQCRNKRGRVRSTWIIQYRNNRGRSRRMTIADGTLPAIAAREMAVRKLAEVKLGSDPQGERITNRAKPSLLFKVAAEAFYEAGIKFGIGDGPTWRPKTARHYRYALFFYPKMLQELEIDSIDRGIIASMLNRVQEEHGRGIAHMVRVRLSTFFGWLMTEGHIEVNPVVGTRKIEGPKARERALSISELVKVWHTCDYECDSVARIIRLLILTGARRQEIVAMQRSEFDPDSGMWTLSEARSKNHRALKLPLPPVARDLITGMHTHPDWICVFSKLGHTNLGYPLKRFIARCNFKETFRIHDLRRSAATGMADIGIQPHIIECVLNHYSGFRKGVAGVYNRSTYEREIADALLRWSEYLLAKIEGRPDNVVPLRTA